LPSTLYIKDAFLVEPDISITWNGSAWTGSGWTFECITGPLWQLTRTSPSESDTDAVNNCTGILFNSYNFTDYPEGLNVETS